MALKNSCNNKIEKIKTIFFCICKMCLISAEGYKNANVYCLK